MVSCFLEYNHKILLLKRQSHKPQPNTYGVPAGKVDKNESKENAILRELFEETGIKLSNKDIKFYKTKFVKYKDYHFVYHIYHCKLNYMPEIKINNEEHKEFLWETPYNSLKLNLIEDGDHCIKDYYKIDI